MHEGEEGHWMDDIKTWTGLSVEESIRMTEDKDKWRKYVHGVANARIEEAKEQKKNKMAHPVAVPRWGTSPSKSWLGPRI